MLLTHEHEKCLFQYCTISPSRDQLFVPDGCPSPAACCLHMLASIADEIQVFKTFSSHQAFG